MKSFFYFLLGAMMLNSCTILEFPKSQPKEAELLQKFPEHMLGTYYDGEKDTLVVTETSLTFGSNKSLINIDEKLIEGRMELKQLKEFYVLNLFNDLSDNSHWTVIPFLVKGEVIHVFLLDIDELMTRKKMAEEEVVQEINQIVEVESVETKDGKMTFFIDPTPKEFETLINRSYFLELGKLQKIK